MHRSRARAGACIYPGSALAGFPPRPRTNGTTTRWMVLASQVAAVLAVVISLLLLEAERALAGCSQAGEDSEEQPDDAPDGETPLARFAAGQAAVCFGGAAWQTCATKLQFSADADNQPAGHLYLLPHQFFGGIFGGTSGTASGTAVRAEAPIRAANVKSLRNGYLLPPDALNTMD